MSAEQLERFGDYLLHREPLQPFTSDEVRELEKLKKMLDDECPSDGSHP
jgi:hypothetical protein